jgi:hypothetical protein
VDLQFEQALTTVHNGREVRWQAQSAGFLDEWKSDWEPHLLAAVVRLGSMPCLEGLCVRSLPLRRVGICRMTDLDGDPPTVRGVQLLVLTEEQYRAAAGDPFAIAGGPSPNWHARGSVSACTLTAPQPRTVVQVCEVLKSQESPSLLGAAQALVDGSRVAWVRPQHDAALLRSLWTLLPTATRAELRLASWVVGAAGEFHAVVVPRIEKGDFDHRFLSEEQAANYPEGRYELGVQAAAEAGDQAELNRLFARRSRGETWRLGLWVAGLLIVVMVAMAGVKWVMGK